MVRRQSNRRVSRKRKSRRRVSRRRVSRRRVSRRRVSRRKRYKLRRHRRSRSPRERRSPSPLARPYIAIGPEGQRYYYHDDIKWSGVNTKIPREIWRRIPYNVRGEPTHILCPKYSSHDEDVQIGITGTAWVDESSENALTREVYEETGLSLDNYYYEISKERQTRNNIVTTNWYIASDNHFRPSKHQSYHGNPDDDQSKKVGIMLYGTRSRLVEYLREARRNGAMNYFRDDNIKSIMIIPLAVVEQKALSVIHNPGVTVSPWNLQRRLPRAGRRGGGGGYGRGGGGGYGRR